MRNYLNNSTDNTDVQTYVFITSMYTASYLNCKT